VNHRFLTRFMPVLAASSLLAACGGGGASAPALNPGNSAAQSSARAVQSSWRADGHAVTSSASPASLEFTADQAAAGTPQTVTIAAKDDGKLSVAIAGTGNCPTVSPSAIKPQRSQHDNRDHDGHDTATATITVTPAGPGPATCTITVQHGDGDDNDADGAAPLTIPVVVDAPVVPTPVPGR
jgi:hypothetical protein